MAVAPDTQSATQQVVRELIHASSITDPVLRITPLWLLTILLRYLKSLEHLPPPPTTEFPPPPEDGRQDPRQLADLFAAQAIARTVAPPPAVTPQQLAHVARVCEDALRASTGIKPWRKYRLDDDTNLEWLQPCRPPPPPPDLTPAGHSFRFPKPTPETAPLEPALVAAAFEVLNPLTNELMEVSYPTT